MAGNGEGEDAPQDSEPPGDQIFDGQAASLRDGAESGPLFAESYRPGETDAEAGLVAGDPSDTVLVAGVGYPLLGDLALGTVVAYRVADWNLPGVAVADCSHTPVAAYQILTADEYETLVLVGTEKRGGELNDGTPSETPGAVQERNVADFEADEEHIVERIGESAMGSNTVENVVLVSEALGGLPDDTRVITVQPGYDSWGMNVDEFTAPVDDALEEVLDRVLEHLDDALDGVDSRPPL
jgi:Ni,Fe-hydrogenase maturation factor